MFAIGGLLSVALSRGRPRWDFPSSLPYGVRTFLQRPCDRQRSLSSLSDIVSGLLSCAHDSEKWRLRAMTGGLLNVENSGAMFAGDEAQAATGSFDGASTQLELASRACRVADNGDGIRKLLA